MKPFSGKVTYCESLNENTGSTATGRYRNTRYATAYTPRPFTLGRKAATSYPTFFLYQRVPPRSTHTATVTVSMEMIDSAAPSGQLSALPNMD